MNPIHAFFAASLLALKIAAGSTHIDSCDTLVRPSHECVVDDPATCEAVDFIVDRYCPDAEHDPRPSDFQRPRSTER